MQVKDIDVIQVNSLSNTLRSLESEVTDLMDVSLRE